MYFISFAFSAIINIVSKGTIDKLIADAIFAGIYSYSYSVGSIFGFVSNLPGICRLLVEICSAATFIVFVTFSCRLLYVDFKSHRLDSG